MNLGIENYPQIFAKPSPAAALKAHEADYFANRVYLTDVKLLLGQGQISAAVKLLWDAFSGNSFVNIRNAILDGFSQSSGDVVNINLNNTTIIRLTNVADGVEIQLLNTLTGQSESAMSLPNKTINDFHIDFKNEFYGDPSLTIRDSEAGNLFFLTDGIEPAAVQITPESDAADLSFLTDGIEPGPALIANYESLEVDVEPINSKS